VWQALYEELKDKNFIIISVAFDTGGIPAVKDWIRPASAQLPKELLDIMGWEDRLSAKAATPTYPCLIDEKHLVAELYNMVNVPQAVWINEQGRIVRPVESAGSSDGFRTMDRTTWQMSPEAAAAGKKIRMCLLPKKSARACKDQPIMTPSRRRIFVLASTCTSRGITKTRNAISMKRNGYGPTVGIFGDNGWN
jgi:hypothetical protein